MPVPVYTCDECGHEWQQPTAKAVTGNGEEASGNGGPKH
jgi:hypothetical protein